ncbi:hypothetical protein OIE62_01485 [Streptomyces scopuliridis]|uniref:Uncharacterized protein n=1 Tax=Streptomyces scopuliridis TaxID=452529 RepID=A0ACD5A2F9_9ACTN|nr:hypothetical protein OG949_38860 [Streptomyces scopuliridis]WSC03397.1 hypothetical protein OG835_40350 [Streptomyces scopuliridis]WSC10723.1 hypothetical protein OIE62_01485 [Streptomyces scopuliridis]
MMDELHRRLKETARAHRPDRERMFARVERGMAGPGTHPARAPAHRPASWFRVATAAAAATGVLAVGALALAAVMDGGADPAGTVATTPGPASGTPNGPPVDARDGYLRSDGVVDPNSNAYWAQSNITLSTDRPLTALTLELRVAQTGGVRDTGSWRSLPEEDFTVSVRPGTDALVYRWTLKDGVTVPAGEHVFAAQYDHAEGARDAGDDRYTVVATGSGRTAEVRGDFTAAR